MNSSLWAVKCELINYSYWYVQKKCVTLDIEHSNVLFFKIYDVNRKVYWAFSFPSKFSHQDATAGLVKNITVYYISISQKILHT